MPSTPQSMEPCYHPSLSPSETASSKYDCIEITDVVTQLSWFFGLFDDHITSKCSELTIITGLNSRDKENQDELWGLSGGLLHMQDTC